MVMNGVAPSMAELAQLYIGLDFVFTATYLATAPREYLSSGPLTEHEPLPAQRPQCSGRSLTLRCRWAPFLLRGPKLCGDGPHGHL